MCYIIIFRYLFTIISYLIGVFIFATIVGMSYNNVLYPICTHHAIQIQKYLFVSLSSGQVGNVITNRNANRLEFERLLDGAKLYMRHHSVPNGMKKRLLRWYDYSWSR